MLALYPPGMVGKTAPDAYERGFMTDGGEVLLRDKTVWRAGVMMLGVPAVITTAVAAFLITQIAGQPAVDPGAFIGLGATSFAALVTGTCTALFAVLRVTVTTEHLQIQFGVLGPTIPIDAIESVEVAPYQIMRWGGWGVRGLGSNMAYSTTGPGRGFQVVYTKNGAPQRVFVTSYDAEGIVKAVSEAKARRLRPPPTRVAVEVSESDESESEEESESESESRVGDR